jgi:hypothetical protein
VRRIAAAVLLIAACKHAPPPPPPTFTSVPRGALDAMCLRLKDEGISSDLRVVSKSQPLITQASLQALGEAAFARIAPNTDALQAAAALSIPIDVRPDSCARRTIDVIDPMRDSDAMILEFSTPFANPFARKQIGVLARLTVGGESPTWYWIPLMAQKDRWIAGQPSTLSVME